MTATAAPRSNVKLEGFVAPGFEKIRDIVESLDKPFGRGAGSISAYVAGELVVDLWGGDARPGQPWQKDTLAPVASVTKSWAAIIVNRLIEQGVLDYTTPICEWWPEFGAHGKHTVTLREVFLHSSGALGFDDQVNLLDANDCAGWKDLDMIAERLAATKPVWTPGSQHGYHAVSYGWMLNEVVRRTTGKTIGQLFARDVAKPLALDTHLGTTGKDIDRIAHVQVPDLSDAPWLMRKLLAGMTAKGADPTSLAGRALLGNGTNTILDRVDTLMDKPAFMEAEIPASNGTTTTRSLSKLFACLANGGTLDGVTILQPETITLMRSPQAMVKDVVMGSVMPWIVRAASKPIPAAYGFMINHPKRGKYPLGPSPDAFATAGYGGQLAVADPTKNFSFASVCTDFTPGIDKAIQQPILTALHALA